jgi:hypothetical protein
MIADAYVHPTSYHLDFRLGTLSDDVFTMDIDGSDIGAYLVSGATTDEHYLTYDQVKALVRYADMSWLYENSLTEAQVCGAIFGTSTKADAVASLTSAYVGDQTKLDPFNWSYTRLMTGDYPDSQATNLLDDDKIKLTIAFKGANDKQLLNIISEACFSTPTLGGV